MPEVIIKFAGFGYLIALSVFGYAILLAVIRNKYGEKNKRKIFRKLATTLHFMLGISGIMFGALYFRDLNGPNDQLGKIVFVVVGLVGLFIVFYAINYLNRHVEWK